MDIWPIVSIGIIVTIVLIGIIVIWIMVKERKSGFPNKDERTQRINGRAATYSLFIGIYFMLALSFIYIASHAFLGYYPFDAGDALIASVLVQSILMLVLRWYFGRKGE
jgi:uncharacterized membrane protein YjgN (DUF898 family)